MTKQKIPVIKDFKPFVPSGKNGYEESKNFYQDIGFTILWTSPEISEIDTGYGHRFLLSANKNKQLGENMMLHFWVESVDQWFEYLKSKKLEEKYIGTKVAEPDILPWGWRIVYVWDPAGVLLHFAEPHSQETIAYFNNAKWLS
jgi:hypothetical protein